MAKRINWDKVPPAMEEKIQEMLSTYDEMDSISLTEAFDYYLRYQGIIGYSEIILQALTILQNAEEEVHE